MKVVITQTVEVHDVEKILAYAKSQASFWSMWNEELTDVGVAVRESVILHHPEGGPLAVGIELTDCTIEVL